MKKFRVVLKILLFIVALILAWYFGSIAYYKLTNENKPSNIDREDIQAGNLGENNTINPPVKDEILFLVAGTDRLISEEEKNSRSDTLMLFKVNFSDGSITELSIPRDTRVYVRGEKTKINHASAYGGIELTMKTIRDWLDIDLDYYVKVNFDSVIDLVDQIGGVRMDVPKAIAKELKITPGVHNLNGAQALAYVRHRKSYITGDIGRVKAQQAFISQIIKQTLTTKNVLRAPILLDILYKNVDTNIPKTYFVTKLGSLAKFSSDKSKTYMIPGDGKYIGDVSYYIYFKDETIKMRDKLFSKYRLNGVNYLENW